MPGGLLFADIRHGGSSKERRISDLLWNRTVVAAAFLFCPFHFPSSASVIAFGRCLGFSDFGWNYVFSGHGFYPSKW